MDPADLDRLLDRELKGLPGPRAPQTLLPRVMAATVGQRGHAPAATGWATWSAGWQAATVGILLLFIAGLSWLVAAPPAPVAAATRTAGETAAVLRAFWDVLLQPVATYIFVVAVALALACAAAWAAFEVALGGATHQ